MLVGNYGSGKTELAIALARYMKKQGFGRVALVDLDIVNPYFRSGEKRQLLQSEGIEVFMPTFALSTVDIPALPAEIQGVFEQNFDRVILDVGGDDTGATALGRYAPYVQAVRQDMEVLYVVNPFRPLSGTEEDVVEMCRLISQKARVSPDALVNNGNLQELTTVSEVLEAQKLLEGVSRRLGIAVRMVTGREALRQELPTELAQRFFSFEPVMKPDWLVDS